jgi:hypothetical protein
MKEAKQQPDNAQGTLIPLVCAHDERTQSIEAIVKTPVESGNVVCTQPHLKRWGMKKIFIMLIITLVTILSLSTSYVLWVKSKCAKYVEQEVIGTKDYYVAFVQFSPIPGTQQQYGWRATIGCERYLDGHRNCFFDMSGKLIQGPVLELD